jgi:cupin 2 domain-containing protein
MELHRLLDGLPEDLSEERVDALLRSGSLRIERIVSTGQASPAGFWYEQDEHEWVVVLRGRAALRCEGQADATELGPGDALLLPAHLRHRVEWTSPDEPTVWLAVFWRDP